MSIENTIFAGTTIAAAALAVTVCVQAVTPVEIYDPALQQEFVEQQATRTCEAHGMHANALDTA
jgi:hypothetical protein